MGEYPIANGCPQCNCKVGIIKRNGPHTELICKQCSRHIKFIKKALVQGQEAPKDGFATGAPVDFLKKDPPRYPFKENPFPTPELEVMKKISFQLDVIIDHLGAGQKVNITNVVNDGTKVQKAEDMP